MMRFYSTENLGTRRSRRHSFFETTENTVFCDVCPTTSSSSFHGCFLTVIYSCSS